MEGEGFGEARDLLGRVYGRAGGVGVRGAVRGAFGGGCVVWELSVLDGFRGDCHSGYRDHDA